MSTVIQRSLSGGELDPVLWARSDITKYMSGLRTLRNAYVRRNGGVQAKPGSTMVQGTKSNGKVRLIPFVYSSTSTYVIEFGDKYLRFYQNGAPYTLPVGGIPAYNAGTAYSIGQFVSYNGVNYYCCFAVSPTTGTIGWYSNFTLYGQSARTVTGVTPGSVNSGRSWYPLTGNTYEIPTPWAIADVPNLRFDQTGNDMVITHPSYFPMRLSRTSIGGYDAFQLFYVTTGSYMGATAPTNSAADSNTVSVVSAATVWAVAAVAANTDTRAESGSIGPGTEITTTNSVPSSGAPLTISWTAVPNAVSYNIYKLNKNSGVYGYIGSTVNTSFQDNGITPDFTNPWIQWNVLFNSQNNMPACVGFGQQRTFYGNTNNSPTGCWGSQTGLYDNFNIHVPSIATDSLSFLMIGYQDLIQHIVYIGDLLVFTYGTINAIRGDSSGAISPSAINPHRESVQGASSLKPLIVGEFAIYCQSQGSIIRDLGFNFQVDGYRGDDLTVFATHLFDNYTIVDWAYQSTPNSIVWAVRSDGVMLSMTYVREQQILAWARHDSPGGSGFYENVCCVPEGNQVSVYVVTNRTINGSTARFVERFYNQQFSDARDYIGMDCATTIDGRNTTTDTVTLSGGTNWNETELLTATLNHTTFMSFTSGMATNNDMLFIYDSGGKLYRFKITAYTSATVVQGFLDRTLPVSLQGVGTAKWSHASKVATGLSYLEGQNVSIFADGAVVGSPNNPNYTTYTVTGGQLTLDQPYAVLHIGLPFMTDIETLDIDTPGALDNLGDKFKLVGEVTIYMVNSRSVWVGGSNPDLDLTNSPASAVYRLTEQKLRQWEGYDSTMSLVTGKITQTIQPEWDQNGHVFIRNVDPTPLIVSAISPGGLFPIRGA